MHGSESGVVLFTGFPGFLAEAVLPLVLARLAHADALCVVRADDAERARSRAMRLTAANPSLQGRIRFVTGDLTRKGLGLADREFASRVVEIVHLAAEDDLSASRDSAMRVNADGTQRVLDLARECSRLRRFHHVSTAHVSGRWRGTFLESMLEEGQEFHNAYEESRQLAELHVRRAISTGLSATIYRPSIVVGDSATGATDRRAGPYALMHALLAQSGAALRPVLRDGQRRETNVVPRDYVAGAIAWLGGRLESLGRTYALADAAPLTVNAMLETMAHATGVRSLRIPLPTSAATLLADTPGIRSLMRIPSGTFPYLAHPSHYDTAHTTADLAPSGIRCPAFVSYLPALVAYRRAHARDDDGANRTR